MLVDILWPLWLTRPQVYLSLQTPNHETITKMQNPQYNYPRCLRPHHQLSESFALSNLYHRPIADPPPCQKQ